MPERIVDKIHISGYQKQTGENKDQSDNGTAVKTAAFHFFCFF